MNYIRGSDREEILLLPEALEDYIGADNPVRFIEVFVGQLDLQAAGLVRASLADTGRPPYDPGDLLRLYLYGYLNRVRSSRSLEREAGRNLELMWLWRKLRPDFKTIADFRKEKGLGIKRVCGEFTLLCRKLELFGGELVAIDWTKIKAQNAKGRNYSAAKVRLLLKEVEKKVSSYLKELDQVDGEEGKEAGPARLSATQLQEKIAQLKQRRGGNCAPWPRRWKRKGKSP
jgi:transposase